MSSQRNHILNQLYNQDILQNGIEDADITYSHYQRTLAFQFLNTVFSLAAIILSELVTSCDFSFQVTDQVRIKNAILLLTILSVVALLLEAVSRIKWETYKNHHKWSPSQEYIRFLWRICLVALFPNNYFSWDLEINTINGLPVTIHTDDVLTIFVLLRFSFLLQFLIHCSNYYGCRPDRVAKIYSVKFDTFASIKLLINEQPLAVISALVFINLFLIPKMLHKLEGKINPSLMSFSSCLHFAIVTQATVGYGNVDVITHYGRFISILTALTGVYTISLVLIYVSGFMILNSSEEEPQQLINNLENTKLIKKEVIRRLEFQYDTILLRTADKNEKDNIREEFRFINRRKLQLKREQVTNLKRDMLKNFTDLKGHIDSFAEMFDNINKLIFLILNENMEILKKSPKNVSPAMISNITRKVISPLAQPPKKVGNRPQILKNRVQTE